MDEIVAVHLAGLLKNRLIVDIVYNPPGVKTNKQAKTMHYSLPVNNKRIYPKVYT